MKYAFLFLAALCVSACGQDEKVNPPTQPAQPITEPGAVEAPGVDRPGTGAPSFIGDWAGDVAWCAAPQGERRPIVITATRFEGYENRCDITDITEVGTSYYARLNCLAQGAATSERVRMTVSDQIMRLTYLDRDPTPVELNKCTTLGETSDSPPSVLPGG